MKIQPALSQHADQLAYLINLAGEGIPEYLWQKMAEPGETAQEVGRRRAAREEGGFSYRHAQVILGGGQVVAMCLAYALPDPYPEEDLSDCPDVVRPLVMLESQAPGSWYINAVATRAAYRGQGLASVLLKDSERRALQMGCPSVSLIVASENRAAKRLYDHLGFEARAQKPLVPYPGAPHGGDWLLMVKPLS
ncbi:GNAT family N-acetyltransferase [Ferrimonas balearica]|uniref:GNAT family N-acetyltransferase n=1 Tax=Ferrimonas balearica TaxID=44012 RepID=UPI001C996D8B|nr:GNAT family N-acetyltransferase [Ferrimonas balearica]MBY5991505.1 GNAT family N-acetyltransferase [Ferrimonas balearica]